jgi:Tripartite tricarboxylate transporter family receptor
MKGRRMLPFRAQLGIFVVVAAGFAQPAWTQTYPTQNITLQVAFAAGGIADVVARLVGQKLSERFGQAVVVENRGGAGGNLAAKSVTRRLTATPSSPPPPPLRSMRPNDAMPPHAAQCWKCPILLAFRASVTGLRTV